MDEARGLEVFRSGGCQCGAVRFRAERLVDNPHVCHCRMCQKASGNFFAALIGVPKAALTWTRGTPTTFMSSAEAERGFCRDCGTPLFFHHLGGTHVSFMMGAFDDPAHLPALGFEFGAESRLPQVDDLAHLPQSYVTEEDDPEGAAAIAASNRQHPDFET